jgi:hypothetical protein
VNDIETVPVDELQRTLGFNQPIDFPQQWRMQPLPNWKMAADDVILRYVFRNLRPCRHLEFGTWRGDGVVRCVEECDATVWTINVLTGEAGVNGDWAYGELVEEGRPQAPWTEQLVTNGGLWMRTDSYGQIGRVYLDAGWGKRVCQIYADSREWDTRAYPDGFFDTAFIDGSHVANVVENDTRKAIQLVRGGGLVIWHDFCPLDEVTRACSSTRDVVGYVQRDIGVLRPHFTKLFWVDPSWLLFGVRAIST